MSVAPCSVGVPRGRLSKISNSRSRVKNGFGGGAAEIYTYRLVPSRGLPLDRSGAGLAGKNMTVRVTQEFLRAMNRATFPLCGRLLLKGEQAPPLNFGADRE